MAKKQGKTARELDSVNASVEAMINQYESVSKKDRKALIKKLKKEEKSLSKEFFKTHEAKIDFKIRGVQAKLKQLENFDGKINVNYGIFNFKITPKYLRKLKDKEQFFDGKFHQKMKRTLEKFPAPKNEQEAKELEGLITQYSKKIRDTKFYTPELVENNINKLTNFRNRLNDYNYSSYIRDKKILVYAEISEKENQEKINLIDKKLKGSKGKEKTKLNKEKRELKKEIREANKKANKEVYKSRTKELKQEKELLEKRNKSTLDLDELIQDLKDDYDSGNYDLDINEEIYKAMEQAIMLDGLLIGMRFNFF